MTITIRGVGPSKTPPFIPEYLISNGVDENGKAIPYFLIYPDGSQVPAPEKVDGKPLSMKVEPGQWVGVRHTGEAEVFPIPEEKAWRAKEAQRCLNELTSSSFDPIQKAETIHQATQLIGLDISSLTGALRSQRGPNEDIEDVWDRVKNMPLEHK